MTRERKSLIAGVDVLILTVILAGVAVTAHTKSEPEPEWLMVMNVETGGSQPAGDTYTLTLEGVDAEMLAFTDRPEREAQRGTSASSWTPGRTSSVVTHRTPS